MHIAGSRPFIFAGDRTFFGHTILLLILHFRFTSQWNQNIVVASLTTLSLSV
jgi:hypothetical protein